MIFLIIVVFSFSIFVPMFKNKNLISLIYTLVFIFPLMYQPYHDVMHHGDYHEHQYGINSSQEKCLVYEYSFASFDIPQQINFESLSPSYYSALNTVYNEVELNLNIFFKTSRAPPTKA